MKRFLITIYIAFILGCSGAASSNVAPDDPKPAIEQAVRSFWAAKRNGPPVSAVSMQKIGDVYLVSSVFEGREDVAALKTVAQQFKDANGVTTWRIEPFNDRWRSLLRIQE